MKKGIKRIMSTAVATAIIGMPIASLAANVYVGNVGFNLDKISNEATYKLAFQQYAAENYGVETIIDTEQGPIYSLNDKSNRPGVPVNQLPQKQIPTNAVIWDGTGIPGENPAEVYAIELKVETDDLKADGKTVMKVTGELVGKDVEKFEGTAVFESKYGLVSAQKESAFDKGKVVFNVTLPNSKTDIQDIIDIKIKSHGKFGDYNLVGLKSAPKSVVYKGFATEGSETLVKSYSIDKVRSADVADRVVVYVGNVAEEDINNTKRLENLKAAIVDQVKVYTKNADTGIDNEAIDLIEVIGTERVSGGYAFTVLTKLPAYQADRNYSDTPNILIDNQYNYYYVADSTTQVEQGSRDNIKLSPLAKDPLSRFALVDKVKPEIRAVKASDNDEIKLPSNSLLVTFSEAVNRTTAEKSSNWVINGNKLSDSDVESIKVLDLKDTDTAYTAVKTGNGLERNQVILKLTPDAAKRLLVTGTNLLQARSIADWAGMYDLSDNNKITTQDFEFEYKLSEATVESVNPYIIWSYADDDKEEVINGETVYNDYVYVLYSRPMSIEAIRASTYDVNGKQVNQDADITRQNIDLYKGNKSKAQLVTIKLPSDFIVGGDDIDGDRDGIKRKNVLTVPSDLKAIDDGVTATSDSLLFDNNNGSNQFELSFFKENIYTDLLKVTINEANQKFSTPEKHFGEIEEVSDVEKVIAQIAALPAAADVTEASRLEIEAARTAYNALNDVDKAAVTNLNVLEAAEEALEGLVNEDQKAADAVVALIDALPEAEEVTEGNREAIEAARAAYDALTPVQKELVDAAKLDAAETALPDAPKATKTILEKNVLPGEDKVEILLSNVANPADYKISYNGLVFRYVDGGKFIGVMKNIATVDDLVIEKK